MAEEEMKLKERVFWRESDETEQEKKGQTYEEQIQDLKEFGDRRTDELEKRLPAIAQEEEAKMEIK